MEEFLEKVGYNSFVKKIESLGYYLKNRIHLNRENLRDVTVYITDGSKINIILENKKYKLSKDIETYYGSTYSSEKCFRQLILAKVNTYIDSAKEFGNANVKARMHSTIVETIGDKQIERTQLFEITELIPNYLSRKSGNNIDVVSLYDEEKKCSYKFCLSDIEFIYPDVEALIKGYNSPKDRKKYIGSVVRVVKKDNKAPLDTICTISNIIKMGGGDFPKRFCEVVTKDKEVYRINETKLKVINNDNKKVVKEESLKKAKSRRSVIHEFITFGTRGTGTFSSGTEPEPIRWISEETQRGINQRMQEIAQDVLRREF